MITCLPPRTHLHNWVWNKILHSFKNHYSKIYLWKTCLCWLKMKCIMSCRQVKICQKNIKSQEALYIMVLMGRKPIEECYTSCLYENRSQCSWTLGISAACYIQSAPKISPKCFFGALTIYSTKHIDTKFLLSIFCWSLKFFQMSYFVSCINRLQSVSSSIWNGGGKRHTKAEEKNQNWRP